MPTCESTNHYGRRKEARDPVACQQCEKVYCMSCEGSADCVTCAEEGGDPNCGTCKHGGFPCYELCDTCWGARHPTQVKGIEEVRKHL